MRKKIFTTEAQRHRGKPKKGKRNAGHRLGILHVGGRGDREHRDFCDEISVASVSSAPLCLCEPRVRPPSKNSSSAAQSDRPKTSAKIFTTETQRHRGKPKERISKGGRRLGIPHVGGRGDREHRDFCDHVCVPSFSSVPLCLGEPRVRPPSTNSSSAAQSDRPKTSAKVFTTEAQRHRGKPKEGHAKVASVVTPSFFKRGTKREGPNTTSTISPCSLSPLPPPCATLRVTAPDRNPRRPIFLGFPLCLCASVVNNL